MILSDVLGAVYLVQTVIGQTFQRYTKFTKHFHKCTLSGKSFFMVSKVSLILQACSIDK